MRREGSFVSDKQLDNSGAKYLRTKSTDELNELIRSVSLAEEIDVEFLDILLAVVGECEPAPDANVAYEEFKRLYSGQQEIYPFDDADNSTQTLSPKVVTLPRGRKRLMRVGLVAAVIIVLLMVGTITASAFGFDLWRAIAQWTVDTFWFDSYSNSVINSNVSKGNENLSMIENALLSYGITEPLVPNWFPEGFEMAECNISIFNDYKAFNSYYKNEEHTIIIQIVVHNLCPVASFEKDERGVTTYIVGGHEHYIMTNNSMLQAVWTFDNYECSIHGNLTESEIKTMLDSIYEGK
jgi:hypothetical protein